MTTVELSRHLAAFLDDALKRPLIDRSVLVRRGCPESQLGGTRLNDRFTDPSLISLLALLILGMDLVLRASWSEVLKTKSIP